jgi:hypothetical protein
MNAERYIVLDSTGTIDYKASFERCKQILSEEKFQMAAKIAQLKADNQALHVEYMETNKQNRCLIDRLLNQNSACSSPIPSEASSNLRSSTSTPTIMEKTKTSRRKLEDSDEESQPIKLYKRDNCPIRTAVNPEREVKVADVSYNYAIDS